MELQSVEDLLSTTQHNKNQELMEVCVCVFVCVCVCVCVCVSSITSRFVFQFPLVDVPAPVRRPDEKLLIDLSNTPDLVRNHSAKPCGGQVSKACVVVCPWVSVSWG